MTRREDHDKESPRSKNEREKTYREAVDILAKVHRQHFEGKGTNLKEVQVGGLHLSRIARRKKIAS